MDVLGDLVARSRRSDAPAFRHAPAGREYDYRRFCTTAWKVGNFLRNEGVRRGATVVVAPAPAPEPVLTLFGAALLGATVQVGGSAADAKALVAPTARVADFDPGPGTRRVGYDAPPDDPAVSYFERDVWSENPTEPPDDVAPDDAAIAVDGGTVTHATLLAAGRRAVEDWGLTVEAGAPAGAGASVALRAPLAHPGAVAAGLVAPLLAGAAIVVPDGETTADVAVAASGAPEPSVAPDAVLDGDAADHA